jgi:hypothetical protein
MSGRSYRAAGVLLALALAAAAPAAAQSKSKTAPKKSAPSEAATRAAPPKVQVAIESVLDRRTTRDFPRSELSITFKLEGDDASAVRSARARLTKASDDTGRSLLPSAAEARQDAERWEEAREEGPPTPKVDLASPSRKAKSLTAIEGVLETYLPSRDPAGTVKIERIMAKKDKPLSVPALASRGLRLQVLSKTGLEKEKKQAEEKKKAQAAKKNKGKKGAEAGLEEMAGAMGDALAGMLERLFLSAGDNDLILKVDDPGKKIFSFDLVAPDGAPIRSFGTMDLEGYRIIRMFEPIPQNASLQIRLKTPKSFGEVLFALANVKLP